MNTTNRVILNTSVLYAQLIINMLVGFVTVPIVLRVLGEDNYGTYMLVAGVVGALGVLNSSMSGTSMRYIAYWLGAGDDKKIKEVFDSTLLIHIIVGLLTVVLLEIGGIIMFEKVLNIPESSLFQAKIVFQLMIVSTYITIVAVPYDAVMTAHENFISISIIETVFRFVSLGGVLCLELFNDNILIWYGILQFVVTLCTRLSKQIYARVKYRECCSNLLNTHVNKPMLKELLSFTGWNLFGSLGSIACNEIRGIIINSFFGVKLNAAEGITKNVTNIVNQVSVSMTKSINPVMMKNEGSGNRKALINITATGSKFSCLLFSLIGIPFIVLSSDLLNLWLKIVPDFAVIFCQLAIGIMIIEKLTFQITNAIRAVGSIKSFQIVETLILLLVIPLYIVFLRLGFSPVSTYIVGFLTTIICAAFRLYFGKIIVGISPWNYFYNVILKMIIPLTSSLILGFLIHSVIANSLLLRIVFTALSSASMLLLLFYSLSINKTERMIMRNIYSSIINKIHKK